MLHFSSDPGECPICGIAHTACTGTAPGPIVVAQLPARDAAAPAAPASPMLESERLQATLAPGQVTTATYRRKAARA